MGEQSIRAKLIDMDGDKLLSLSCSPTMAALTVVTAVSSNPLWIILSKAMGEGIREGPGIHIC